MYGRLRNLEGDRQFIPFRQLGQYEDIELNGLYYNRFRYYDSNSGLYISKDPIGLAGNNPTMYAYVWDSNGQVDVFGLANQYQIHSPSQPDIVSKGLHFYGKDNIELSIKPNVDGDISFKSVFSTKNLSTKEVDKINNAIKDAQSKFDTDSKWRQHILDNAIIAKETVIEAHGQGKMGDKAKGRSAEFHFIEKNIKKKYK
ncbi:RHS repeat-associated core domain-containing protein [Myroides sp. DF42-4-2]|uniref:RHS repeat domain-containing protein n=1 Tax=Myroides sp. DF42-4-2 TaxID=2746726 RepID=UPI002577EE60|nr:RHS repeat-associated core domain-containing protein [Myroides sp. DF42-4-2]